MFSIGASNLTHLYLQARFLGGSGIFVCSLHLPIILMLSQMLVRPITQRSHLDLVQNAL